MANDDPRPNGEIVFNDHYCVSVACVEERIAINVSSANSSRLNALHDVVLREADFFEALNFTRTSSESFIAIIRSTPTDARELALFEMPRHEAIAAQFLDHMVQEKVINDRQRQAVEQAFGF